MFYFVLLNILLFTIFFSTSLFNYLHKSSSNSFWTPFDFIPSLSKVSSSNLSKSGMTKTYQPPPPSHSFFINQFECAIMFLFFVYFAPRLWSFYLTISFWKLLLVEIYLQNYLEGFLLKQLSVFFPWMVDHTFFIYLI